MECPTRNYLVLSYLRSQADQAEAESASEKAQDAAARQRILESARQLFARRKELLDHCDRHGC